MKSNFETELLSGYVLDGEIRVQGGEETYLYSAAPRPVVGPTRRPIQYGGGGTFNRDKTAGV
jgi:hypothetical protein